jgi:hypothetical protein
VNGKQAVKSIRGELTSLCPLAFESPSLRDRCSVLFPSTASAGDVQCQCDQISTTARLPRALNSGCHLLQGLCAKIYRHIFRLVATARTRIVVFLRVLVLLLFLLSLLLTIFVGLSRGLRQHECLLDDRVRANPLNGPRAVSVVVLVRTTRVAVQSRATRGFVDTYYAAWHIWTPGVVGDLTRWTTGGRKGGGGKPCYDGSASEETQHKSQDHGTRDVFVRF